MSVMELLMATRTIKHRCHFQKRINKHHFQQDGIGNFDIALKNVTEKKKADGGEKQTISIERAKEYDVENFKFKYFLTKDLK
jgi:hypothetical protein